MQLQPFGWFEVFKCSFGASQRRSKLIRLLCYSLVLPMLITVSSISPAQAATLSASDSYCTQTVSSTSGVTVLHDGNSCVVRFTAPSNTTTSITWTVPTNVTSVAILVVGGGGSGGVRHGAGGGAGGYRYLTGISVTPSSNISISVGKGGDAIAAGSNASNGNSGVASSFGSYSAAGGGFGGQTSAGGSGGSGGGGCCSNAAGVGNTPSTSPSQGNDGGTGTRGSSEWNWSGGGGGGAGGVGGNSTSTSSIAGAGDYTTSGTVTGGAGGAGVLNSITGTSTCYAAGGGGGVANSGTAGGNGGSCGSTVIGGNGGKGSSLVAVGSGTDGTGSGGGGGGFEGGTNGASGRGGSGVVVIRYDLPTVSININNGTGYIGPTSISSNADGTFTLPARNSLTRTGYQFGGWNTAADGSGTTYAEASTISSNSNLTLYPRWNPTITFDGNGYTTEAATVPAPIYITNNLANNSLPIAYGLGKNNYTFGGWNTNSTGTGTSYPGSNVNLVGLPTPYLRLEAANYNTSTNTWVATNGSNVPSTNVKSSANISKVTSTASNGTSGSFTVLRGTSASGIALGNAELTSGYTFCAVARVTANQATKSTANGGRLFDGVTYNWLSGWWSGYQRQFYHLGWMNGPTESADTNFHLICDRAASNRWDGVQQPNTTGGGTNNLPPLSINNGYFTGGVGSTSSVEVSPWEVAEVIIYNSTLQDSQVAQVEAFLKHRYGITAATSSYSAGTATGTYQALAPQTLYAQWNSVITYNSNNGTSGSVPSATTITGLQGTLATNTGSLAKSPQVFLGWYTNMDGVNGTFYPPGGIYPNSGITTLYAYYGSALSFPGSTTLSAVVGTQTRSETYTAVGGFGNYRYTAVLSPSEPGITLDTRTANSFAINVSPTVRTGTYYETVTVTDSTTSISKLITITVANPLLWDTANATSLITTVGKPNSLRLNFSGGIGNKSARLVHVSNPAPRGVTLDTSTVASGFVTLRVDTTTAAGTYLESITVSDSGNLSRVLVVTITVNAPPDITYSATTDAEYPYLSQNLLLNVDASVTNSYSGSGTVWNDISTSSRTFNFRNDAGTAVTPVFNTNVGGALTFDGTNHALMSTSLPSLDSYTVEAWFNSAENISGKYGPIITDIWAGSGNKINYYLGYGPSGSQLCGTFFDGNAWSNAACTTISINTWYHVAYTLSQSVSGTRTLSIYINGQLMNTATTTLNPGTSNLGNRIGRRWDAAEFFKGQISAVRVYRGVLTPTQILANYANTKPRFLSLSAASPTISGNATLSVTEGKSATFQVFSEVGGTGANTYSLSGANPKISLSPITSDQTAVVVDSTITPTNSTTSKSYFETLTATDSTGAATAYYLTINVAPKIAMTATSDTVTTTFGIAAFDTITTTAGTGTGNITLTRTSSSGSSAITHTSTIGSPAQAVMTIGSTLPAGTYYETFTATDSAGATSIKVITIIVNPALSMSGPVGNKIETTFSRATTSTLTIAGGTGTRSASITPTVSGITLTTTNLATGSLIVNVANTVAAGTYLETVTVTDSLSATSRLLLTVIVNTAPTITYNGATSGALTFTTTAGGSVTTNAFTAALGTGNKTFTLSGANSGISIDTSTTNSAFLTFGPTLVSTNTTTPRTYNETLTVTDSFSVTTTRAISVIVNPAIIETATTTTITTTSGIESTTVINATQGTGNKTFTLIDTSNGGVTLTSGTNQATLKVLSTANPGTYSVTVNASDTTGAVTGLVIQVIVSPPPSILGSARIETTQGVLFRTPLYSISGGTGSLTLSLSTAPSNGNISLINTTSSGANLQISTGAVAGTYISTIRVTDQRGSYSELPVTIVINAPVTLSGSLTINKTYGNSTVNGYSTNGTGTAPFSFAGSPVCAVVRTVSGSYTYEKINGTDTCTWTAPVGVTSVDALLVGAGGGGGPDGGAGGGGGSINTLTSVSLPANRQLSVQIGSGGSGGIWAGSSATAGGTTSITAGSTTYTAPGGSAGGGCGSAGAAGGSAGTGGTASAGGNGGFGATGSGCAAGSGAAGSNGPSSSFTGSSVTYGGGGGGGPFPNSITAVGLNAGGSGGGGTGTQASGQSSYGLPQYFRALGSTPSNATLKEAFTTGTCGALTGNIGYATDSEFPCSQKDNFQGYATGYFVSPVTGSITFYLSSDDSSDLVINVNGTNNELQLSTCCTTVNATWTGFVAGQAYPIQVYFTEVGGLASWKLEYSYAGVSQTVIPVSQFRSGSYGLATYFRANNTTAAANKNTFTTGTCAQRIGNIDFANDAAFPCDGKDNFQGYATGYFVSPVTGSIIFTLSSDDSSLLAINVNGTNNELSLSIGTTSATWSGFVKGQYYPMSVFFTELQGSAVWKLEYEYTGQTKIVIPTDYLRSNADFVSPTAGVNGLGGGGGAGSAGLYKISGAPGGSGTVIIKYLTQSDSATETYISALVNQETPSGLLTLSVPAYVNAGTYSQTIKVQDAANSAPYSATITITVNKATPTLTLSLPGSVTTAKYGTPVRINAVASTSGTINFKKGGTSLSGCSAVSTSSGVASCIWTPSVVETASISALLTPADSTNFNTNVETVGVLTITVGRADTLTVTASSATTTYTESSGSATTTIPTPTISFSGLASIDSITAATFTYSGTQNNGSSYSASTTAPRVAGTYAITPSAAVFTSPGLASNYQAVNYVAGTLTINRASRGSWSASYNAGSNATTFAPNKTETVTITAPGDGARLFTTSSTTCSVDSSSGALTLLSVGACDLQVVLLQSANWLSDTKTVTVLINRGPRSATATPARTTLKYGETTTVLSAIALTANPAITSVADSATVTYSHGSSTGCQIDPVTGVVTAISGSGTCSITVTYSQTTLYEAAASTPASITITKASAPVVTTDSITAISYTGSRALLTPTYTVSGIVGRDILAINPLADVSSSASIAAIPATDYTSVSTWRYRELSPTTTYDSTTAPTLGGTYAVTAQSLTLLGALSMANYETPTYIAANLVITPIAQAPLRITLSFMDSVTVPYDVTVTGGSSSGALSLAVISGGSATGCTVDSGASAMRLKSTTPGTCIIQVTKAADRNYLIAISDTQTVNILNFVADIIQLFENPAAISINRDIPLIKGADVCQSACVPTITAIQDTNGVRITEIQIGIPFRIVGTNFTTTTNVFFRRSTPADSFQIDSDTQLTVLPPSTLPTGDGVISIAVVASGGRSFPNGDVVKVFP